VKRSRKVFALILTVSILLVSAGCERCTTCTYTQTSFGVTSTYEEDFCGDKDEVEAFEEDFKEDAQQQGVTATCSRKDP
jgi:hypothetical protein